MIGFLVVNIFFGFSLLEIGSIAVGELVKVIVIQVEVAMPSPSLPI